MRKGVQVSTELNLASPELVKELESLVQTRYESSMTIYVALWGKALAYLTEEQVARMIENEKVIQETQATKSE